MPTPAHRSRSFARKRVTTPGGRVVIHYRKKHVSAPKCRSCGKVLHGVARGRQKEIGKLSKSERKPERPYGGNLCSPCTRKLMKSKNMERWEND
jgi:large subunit ribosomal protein L34e